MGEKLNWSPSSPAEEIQLVNLLAKMIELALTQSSHEPPVDHAPKTPDRPVVPNADFGAHNVVAEAQGTPEKTL